jgi:calcineurin-like phosphoesterase family protein
MKILIITDTHFNHDVLIEKDYRPKNFVDKLYKNLYKNIAKDDLLIHLGDVCMGNDEEENTKFCLQINCKKWLVAGNHDTKCVSKKTRILTRDGYKYWNEISDGDIIPTVNLETGKVEFNPILDVYVYKNEPYIYRAHHRSGEMELTAHHTVLYQSGLLRNSGIWKKNIAENLWNTKNEIVIPTHFSSSGTYKCDLNLLKLLAWIMTDGSINKRGSIIIYQSKQNYIKEIKDLLSVLNIPYSEKIRDRKIEYICGKPLKSSLPAHEFFIPKKYSEMILQKLSLQHKYHIPEWLFDISDDDFNIFLKELVKGDGSFRKNGHCVIWGNKEWLCSIIGLCVTHNIHANLLKQSGRDNYYIGIRTSKGHKQYSPKNLEKVVYNDLVWCVNVKNNNFFAELNGKTFVTGNSKTWYVEHGWDWCGDSFIWDLYGKKILFSHIPQKKNSMFDINIHGHFHDFSDETIAFHEPAIFKIIDEKVHYLVSMEQTKYQPIQLKTIIDKFKSIESD